jgi:hypothetical protein
MAGSLQGLEMLNKNMEVLNKSISRSNSFGRNILLSLLKGVGTALGAGIVAAVVIAILARSIKTLADVPIIGSLVESSQVEQYISP